MFDDYDGQCKRSYTSTSNLVFQNLLGSVRAVVRTAAAERSSRVLGRLDPERRVRDRLRAVPRHPARLLARRERHLRVGTTAG